MSESIPPQSGRVIDGKYRIDSMIGEGAMGTVWSATHIHLGQRVAVKLIAPELADSDGARQRFDSEARAAAALRSRFVVTIHDSGITDDGIPYLVMEYLNGEVLWDRVDRVGPLSLRYAIELLAQVARGLACAHRVGIVHRDLKPDNVFLAQTGDGEEVAKILDFGVAKFRNAGPAQSTTATGAVVGTPLFMSPEQARGLKTVDHRSDLYSLGMLAYFVLTGENAFAGEAFGDLLLTICTHPLPSLHEVAPWLPEPLDAWFKKACALEQDDRFQTAQELIAALVEAAGVDPSELAAVARLAGSETSRFAMGSSPNLVVETGAQSALGTDGAATLQATVTATGLTRSSPARRVLNRAWTLPLMIAAGAVAAAATGGGIMLLATAASSGSAAPFPSSAGEPITNPTASIAGERRPERALGTTAAPRAPSSAAGSAPSSAAGPASSQAEATAELDAPRVRSRRVVGHDPPPASLLSGASEPHPKPSATPRLKPAAVEEPEIDIGF